MLDQTTNVKVEVKASDAADASRFYGELLEKARGEVLESMVITDNKLTEFHALRMASPYPGWWRIVLAFRLNGELYVTETKMSQVETLVQINKVALIETVIRKMSEVIAEKLLTNFDSL